MVDALQARKEFDRIYDHLIKRDWADDLYKWLSNETDFFTAPASSKYHLAEPGGLVQHSINVYNRLRKFLMDEYGDSCPYDECTIATVALLHDVCKANFYRPGWKNQKTYDPEKVNGSPPREVRSDASGRYIWETVPTYEIDDRFVYGHGEKSVYLISKYIWLSDEEAQAIRFHMGAWNSEEARNYGNACEKNPLVFFLHMADSAASFIDEGENK